MVSLKHRNEILAWIADRKRNFPTQERVAARKAADKLAEKQNRDIQHRAGGKHDSNKRPEKANAAVKVDAQLGSDDEAPEEVPIAKEAPPSQPTNENISERSKTPCKYFLRDGYCRRRDCRFLHESDKVEREPTLMERVSSYFVYRLSSLTP
jgi:hypothetical protein